MIKELSSIMAQLLIGKEIVNNRVFGCEFEGLSLLQFGFYSQEEDSSRIGSCKRDALSPSNENLPFGL